MRLRPFDIFVIISALALAAPVSADDAAVGEAAVDAVVDAAAAEAADAAADVETEAVEAEAEASAPILHTTRPEVMSAGAASAAAAAAEREERERAAAAEAAKPKPKTVVVPSPQAKNITTAMAAVRPGDTVRVMNGTYRESIFLAPGVTLVANAPFKAILDGKGKGRGKNTAIVTMGTGSVISGFEIKNGTIGVFSASAGAVIKQCRIIGNVQSGIMCVGVLPRIEDNFIVSNKGSGIQGWDVRTTSGSINHNTIAFNSNHGISLGGNTSVTIENNIIAFNDQFGVKPGSESVRVVLANNNLYQNARISTNLPTDNMSADPLFVDARRLNFNLMKESRCIGQGTGNQNLGARILH